MQPPKKSVSPGVKTLIPSELQAILWALHEAQPLLPCIFDLRKGRGRYVQHINHLCLLPYYDQVHTVELAKPLNDISITLLRTDTGLLMRLSNKQLEQELSKQSLEPDEPAQGQLF